MDIGSIFLILALLVLVGLFVTRPLFERRPGPSRSTNQEDHELSSLLAERDRILNALQELDFDHALNKIPEEDYPLQRTSLLQRGADILRKLDVLQVSETAGDAEARLEAVIASRRADGHRTAVPGAEPGLARQAVQVAAPDDQLETLLANRRRERQEKAAGFCPQCGGPIHKSDRFCPKCGAEVA